MRVIFLDIDGVLVTGEHTERNYKATGVVLSGSDIPFDPSTVNNLNWLIKESGAKIVISSSWRYLHDIDSMRGILSGYGVVGDVIGMTHKGDSRRGLEIAEWLRRTKESIESYVILDDDANYDCTQDHPDCCVDTTFQYGLTELHAKRAFEILVKRV